MKVLTIQTSDDLKKFDQVLKKLAEVAITENVFYENFMLAPALDRLAVEGLQVALVLSDDEQTAFGIFPIDVKTRYRQFRLRHFGTWRHIQCFLSTPVLAPESAQECLATFFAWAKLQKSGRHLFLFDHIAGDGAFFDQLQIYLQTSARKYDVVERYMRPTVNSRQDGESYLREAISGKHRKDLQSKLRKLEEMGAISYRILSEESEVDSWIQDFLELENSGWKGKDGTAMLLRENEKQFFYEVIRRSFAENKLLFFTMELDGKPIAMRCGFNSGVASFSFKTAFSEAYRKHSPGVLLEMEHIRQIQEMKMPRWVDSCSMPGNEMLGRMWKEERSMTCIAVSSGSLTGNLILMATHTARKIKSSLEKLRRSKE